MIKQTLIFLTLFANFSFGFAQGDYDAIATINGVVYEELETEKKGVEKIQVYVKDIATKTTDEDGKFSFKIPIYEADEPTEITIEITSNDFTVVHPLEGRIGLDNEQLTLAVELFVISNEAETAYVQQLNNVRDSLKSLAQKNSISINALNRLNKQMIDTISYFNRQQKASEVIITQQIESLKIAAADNELLKSKIDSMEGIIQNNRDSIFSLTNQLYVALEEAYLRKQGYFQQISSNLLDYLVRIKDVNDRMLTIENFFPSKRNPAYAAEYTKITKNYNAIFEVLNAQQADYLQGVEHNWESEESAKAMSETFHYLFQQLHNPHLVPSIQEINGFIAQNRMKKAKKCGETANATLSPIIVELEQKILRTLKQLKLEL